MLHHRSGGRVPTTCADCFGISFSFGCTSGCSPLVCASSMLPAPHMQVEMSGAADLGAGAQQVCVPFGACSRAQATFTGIGCASRFFWLYFWLLSLGMRLKYSSCAPPAGGDERGS